MEIPKSGAIQIRCQKILAREGITTLEDLAARREIDLLLINGIWRKFLYDIKEELGAHGLALKDSQEEKILALERELLIQKEETSGD